MSYVQYEQTMSISVVTDDANAGSSRAAIWPLICCVYTDIDIVCARGHVAILDRDLFVDISETFSRGPRTRTLEKTPTGRGRMSDHMTVTVNSIFKQKLPTRLTL